MKYFIALMLVCSSVSAQDFNQYNRQFTYNQQYGSTNWYSSPLGMGVAQAGVALISGLVNVMSRPDPSQYVQPQNAPQYVGNGANYGSTSLGPRCAYRQVYTQNGSPNTVRVCE